MSECFISLLPFCNTPTTLLVGDKLPCHGAKIESMPVEYILKMLNRKIWVEGLYAKENDLSQIKRYKNPDGSYKNDFDEKQFTHWVKIIEDNTAICEMENKSIGKGIFVPANKKLPKGTFIPSSGIIKLDPTNEELETKNHCSALQDLNSPKRRIYGLIDPGRYGGILDLINHAPNEEELTNFKFKNLSVKENISTSNLISTIKFYNGYAIMGVEVFRDIGGENYGKQLLWSYALPDEYLYHKSKLNMQTLLLFDKRNEHNGEIIDVNMYSLSKIDIFLNTADPMLKKIASLTRWEIMESSPESGLIFSIEDPYSSNRSEDIQSSILYGVLQAYLKQNPLADRIIINLPRAP